LLNNRKKYTEFGEKRDDMCRRFRLAESGHPVSACKGDLTEISKVVGGAANDLETFCDETQNSDNAQEEASMICQGRGPVPEKEEPRKQVTDEQVEDHEKIVNLTKAIESLEDEIKKLERSMPKPEDSNYRNHNDKIVDLERTLSGKKKELERSKRTVRADLQKELDATKPVDSKSTADASSTRVSEGSALDSACKNYNECINKKNSKSPELNEEGKTVWVKGECVQLNALAKLVVKAANNRSIGTTPAMCNAANNSGRENSPKGWMGAMDTFNQELRARTQGQ